MPLPIKEPLRIRLIEQVAQELQKATVYANFMISSWSLRGLSEIKSLPERGELAELLRRFIGDDPLSTFVIDELDASFKGPAPDIAVGESPLTNYDGYADLQAIATGLIDSFGTLPWSYRLTVRLPNPFGAHVARELGGVVLSPRHRIVSGTALAAELPQAQASQGLARLMMNEASAPSWEAESAYFQVDLTGYFQGKQTESFLSARDDVLAFFGLGVALHLFSEFPLSIGETDRKTSHFYIHRFKDGAWVEHSAPAIDDQYKQAIGRLEMPDELRTDPDRLRGLLDRIGSVLRSEDGKNNIALSARWLFESHCGRDELLQYVQAAVAIEILLGDEEADPNAGLTTLMANRCAFLIAKTPTGRTNLIKQFRDIYKVRSKIVHRGKSRLNAQELRLFRTLKMILTMVIDHEQRLLERAESLR